jgi:hypothetical protein
MSYVGEGTKNYNSKSEMLTALWAYLSSMGWILEDNQSASYYKVYSSNGESADRIKEYIKVDWATASQIRFYAYYYWNSTTHVGVGAAYSYGYTSTSDLGFTGWIYGNKNLVIISAKVLTTYTQVRFGHLSKRWSSVITQLTAAASSGAGVTITVADTTGFKAGVYYQIIGASAEGRDRVQVSSVTDGTHLVITNLPRNFSIGSQIGLTPSTFGSGSGSGQFYITCPFYVVGTANGSTTDYIASLESYPLLTKSYVAPNERDEDLYYLQPLVGCEYSSSSNYVGILGYNDENIFNPPTGSDEDVFGKGFQDSGTAESGTPTTLTDNDKAWTTNQWTNKILIITAGTGVGQTRKIASNAATQITVNTAFTTNPDNTSQYAICDEAYRFLSGLAMKEII